MSRTPTKKPAAKAAAPPKMHSWAIYHITGTPAKLLGHVEAPSDPATPLESCPCCGAAMRIIEVFKAGQSPRHRPTAMPAAIRIDTS